MAAYDVLSGYRSSSYPSNTWRDARDGVRTNITTEESVPSVGIYLPLKLGATEYGVSQACVLLDGPIQATLPGATLQVSIDVSVICSSAVFRVLDFSVLTIYEDAFEFVPGDDVPVAATFSIGINPVNYGTAFTTQFTIPIAEGNKPLLGIIIVPTEQYSTTFPPDAFQVTFDLSSIQTTFVDGPSGEPEAGLLELPPTDPYPPDVWVTWGWFTEAGAELIEKLTVGVGTEYSLTGLELALFSDECYREAPGTELTGGGYTRISLPAVTPVQLRRLNHTNGDLFTVSWSTLTFPQATENWPVAAYWAIFDNNGTYLFYGPVHFPIEVRAGEAPLVLGGMFRLYCGFSGGYSTRSRDILGMFFERSGDIYDYFPDFETSGSRLFDLAFYTTPYPAVLSEVLLNGATRSQVQFALVDNKMVNVDSIALGHPAEAIRGLAIQCAAILVDGVAWAHTSGNEFVSFLDVLSDDDYLIPAGAIELELW